MPHATAAPWSYTIRPALPTDTAFILTLSDRLDAGGLPPWHATADFHAFHHRAVEQLAALVAEISPEQAVLIAEREGDAQPIALGLVNVLDGSNPITGERQGYVQVLAVTAEAEGHGVGRELMCAAEAWARGRGHRLIALDTAGVNQRSRAFYRGGGYQEEVVAFIKVL
jgi:GNAT superfamily N-acetyltransferase